MSKSRDDGAPALTLGGDDLAAFLSAVVGRGSSFRFRARGSSMRPAIRDGDVITVAPLTGPPRLGDVAAFRGRDGRLVIHRCVGRTREGVLFKGDAVGFADGSVQKADILGLVVRIDRDGREIPKEGRFRRAAKAVRSRVNLRRRLSDLTRKMRWAGRGAS